MSAHALNLFFLGGETNAREGVERLQCCRVGVVWGTAAARVSFEGELPLLTEEEEGMVGWESELRIRFTPGSCWLQEVRRDEIYLRLFPRGKQIAATPPSLVSLSHVPSPAAQLGQFFLA